MAAGFRQPHRAAELTGRSRELSVLGTVLDGVRAGGSRVLVLHGEHGIGKTALLDHLAGSASGCRVARATGVQPETELAFAGIHQLCVPMLEHAERLPAPQREALRTAFAISAGPAPDRFLVGLAMLGLLSAVAAERPLLCVVDDAEWLDKASAQVLGFVARRLAAEPVGLVFAARDRGGELAGLPELAVAGLPQADARALLESAVPGRLDERVRDRIVAEAGGNPLALLELLRGVGVAGLAGGFGLPGGLSWPGGVGRSFVRRLEALPAGTRWLLLAAAAEPVGDAALLWRAAGRLGVEADAAGPAEAAGLVEVGGRVRFCHPLLRAVVYGAAGVAERRVVHRALAEATDGRADPDRRAWHRALAAARAKFAAGAPEAAHELLAVAELCGLGERQRAELAWLRARLAFAGRGGGEAAGLLLDAARGLGRLDGGLAREAYLEALGAVVWAGRLGREADAREAGAAARAAPPPPARPRPADLLLDGVAARLSGGYAAGVAPLRRAVDALRRRGGGGVAGLAGWLPLASSAAEVWDDGAWEELAGRAVALAREAGALGVLPAALACRAAVHVHAGEFGAAAGLISEAGAAAAATGGAPAGYISMVLAAWQGEQARAAGLIEAVAADAAAAGAGRVLGLAGYAAAVLHNGLGGYQAALAAARRACQYEDLGLFGWSLAELIEAAARGGAPAEASAALAQLEERTRAAGTDWALGMLARSRALLAGGPDADALYREAIGRLERTRIAVHLARAHLLYGEWLRREQRRADAREHLRAAHDMLARSGAAAFAGRARRELLATGQTVRKRADGTRDTLTAQETQVARLAADGHTNPEIGARLFISPRTAEYHLHKVFSKLGVTSRRQLRHRLA